MRKLDWSRIRLWLHTICVLGYLCIAAYVLIAPELGWGVPLWIAVVFFLGYIGFFIWLGRWANSARYRPGAMRAAEAEYRELVEEETRHA